MNFFIKLTIFFLPNPSLTLTSLTLTHPVDMVYTSAALLVLFAATYTAPSHSVAQDACTEYLGKAAMPHAQQESLAPYLSTLSVIPLENNRSYPFCFVYGGRASSALSHVGSLLRHLLRRTPTGPGVHFTHGGGRHHYRIHSKSR